MVMTNPTDSFEVEAIWLDGIRLDVIGPIQGPVKVTPLADKITTGDHTRVSDPVLSSWVVEDCTGGLGVLNRDQETQADRYRFGTAWCLNPKDIMLGAGPSLHQTGVPANTRSRLGCTYGTTLYCVFDNKVRYLATATDTWTVPSETGYVDLVGNASSACVMRMAGADWLFIADSQGIMRFNGTSWAYQAGNGTTVPRAQYLIEYSDELYAVDIASRLWHTADGTTWSGLATAPVPSGEVRGLDIFFDNDNKPCPHIAARDGLYQYNLADSRWYRTRLRWEKHPAGGDGHAEWHDEYYLSAGLDIWHYTGTQTTPISLNRDDGLPRDYAGRITCLLPLMNWLAIGVNSADAVQGTILYHGSCGRLQQSGQVASVLGLSAIYFWTGAAFQPFWVSQQSGQQLEWMHASSASGQVVMWWGAGTAVYSVALGNGLFNPREVPTWPFDTSSYLESGRFDAGWAEQTKLTLRTLARTDQTPAQVVDTDQEIDIYYRANRSPNWVLIGTANVPGVYTWVHEQNAGQADGLPWYDWEYKVILRRGSSPNQSPILVYVKNEFLRMPDARYGYRFTAQVHRESGGLDENAIAARLQELSDEKRLISFVFRPADRSPVEKKCFISSFGAAMSPGGPTNCVYSLALEEG